MSGADIFLAMSAYGVEAIGNVARYARGSDRITMGVRVGGTHKILPRILWVLFHSDSAERLKIWFVAGSVLVILAGIIGLTKGGIVLLGAIPASSSLF